ncbi:hypothetical protein BaRGS_00025485 [Batillaria attramentaria]|uniref:Uncharacterized protein n=1 Tax=Batillaria attramentaria TaxID=370345 RepID=A0ABD0K8D5_9CAEN
MFLEATSDSKFVEEDALALWRALHVLLLLYHIEAHVKNLGLCHFDVSVAWSPSYDFEDEASAVACVCDKPPRERKQYEADNSPSRFSDVLHVLALGKCTREKPSYCVAASV